MCIYVYICECSVGGLDLGFSAGTMILAWSMSEMIRYSYYLLRELFGGSADATPYLSTWLRYSGFIVLYPIGVASELSCCLLALPLVKVRDSLLRFRRPLLETHTVF